LVDVGGAISSQWPESSIVGHRQALTISPTDILEHLENMGWVGELTGSGEAMGAPGQHGWSALMRL